MRSPPPVAPVATGLILPSFQNCAAHPPLPTLVLRGLGVLLGAPLAPRRLVPTLPQFRLSDPGALLGVLQTSDRLVDLFLCDLMELDQGVERFIRLLVSRNHLAQDRDCFEVGHLLHLPGDWSGAWRSFCAPLTGIR